MVRAVTVPAGRASGPARTVQADPPLRPPGRPRDTRRDEAIIGATLQALAESGFTGLSMEAVAARAGVGKATVYRRWPSKDALVSDALATLANVSGGVETGSIRDDLVAWLNTVRRHNIQTLSGRIMPRLLAEKETHPDLFETYRERVMAPARERVAAVLRGGIASGELSPDTDVDLVTDMLIGSVAYWQYTGRSSDVSGSRIACVVDTILRGILQRSGSGWPRADAAVVGHPPSFLP